jgi:hypothetical protein
MSSRKHTFAILTLIASLAFLSAVSLAFAGATERAEYKEKVEPICQQNTQANEKILKNVKKEVKQDKLRPAALAFSKAARALKGTLAQLQEVHQPEAESSTLTSWLREVRTEVGLFETVSKKLKAGNKNTAEKTVIHLEHNAQLANNIVLSFEFHYCHFETSRFT